ncbi:MAG: hypothetical protein PUD51_02845, partial [Prevotellaceae bacterium]|nr:hypothetical protein [Prevotellaceae bacterium]
RKEKLQILIEMATFAKQNKRIITYLSTFEKINNLKTFSVSIQREQYKYYRSSWKKVYDLFVCSWQKMYVITKSSWKKVCDLFVSSWKKVYLCSKTKY